MAELKAAIALTQDLNSHGQAQEKFAALQAQLKEENAELAGLLQLLWDAYVSAQRGSAFWQEISEAEKALADGAMAQSIQSKQNYLRLMQEL